MTSLSRVRTTFTGMPGGPGVATFYFLDTATAIPSLMTLWENLNFLIPIDVTIDVPGSGDIIEDTTGKITGTWTQPHLPVAHGLNGGAYAAPAGGIIKWLTTAIVAGRRLKGKTFVVPMASVFFTTAGQLTEEAVGIMQSQSTNFIAAQSTSFVVWSRPFAGKPATATRPARQARVGGHSIVTASSVNSKVAVLRSRRD